MCDAKMINQLGTSLIGKRRTTGTEAPEQTKKVKCQLEPSKLAHLGVFCVRPHIAQESIRLTLGCLDIMDSGRLEDFYIAHEQHLLACLDTMGPRGVALAKVIDPGLKEEMFPLEDIREYSDQLQESTLLKFSEEHKRANKRKRAAPTFLAYARYFVTLYDVVYNDEVGSNDVARSAERSEQYTGQPDTLIFTGPSEPKRSKRMFDMEAEDIGRFHNFLAYARRLKSRKNQGSWDGDTKRHLHQTPLPAIYKGLEDEMLEPPMIDQTGAHDTPQSTARMLDTVVVPRDTPGEVIQEIEDIKVEFKQMQKQMDRAKKALVKLSATAERAQVQNAVD